MSGVTPCYNCYQYHPSFVSATWFCLWVPLGRASTTLRWRYLGMGSMPSHISWTHQKKWPPSDPWMIGCRWSHIAQSICIKTKGKQKDVWWSSPPSSNDSLIPKYLRLEIEAGILVDRAYRHEMIRAYHNTSETVGLWNINKYHIVTHIHQRKKKPCEVAFSRSTKSQDQSWKKARGVLQLAPPTSFAHAGCDTHVPASHPQQPSRQKGLSKYWQAQRWRER